MYSEAITFEINILYQFLAYLNNCFTQKYQTKLGIK